MPKSPSPKTPDLPGKPVKNEKPPKIKKPKKIMALGLGEAKENFLENLSMLLSAGLDLLSALKAIKSDIRSKRFGTLIDRLTEEIEGGSTLWSALARTGLFSGYVVSLIKVGEKSGRLVENIKVVVLQQQKERDFRNKIRSAMMYPAFVMGVTVIVGLGISWFILPKLTKVFENMKVDLPLITKLLIAFGKFISAYGYYVIPLTVVFMIVFFYFVFVFKKTKFIGQFITFNLPIINKLIQQSELARLGYIFGTLLQAGLPLIEALESLSDVSDFRIYKKFYQSLAVSLDEGNSFKTSFDKYKNIGKLIPPHIQQLIIAGEQSGSLPETLIKVGETYEGKIEITTKNLSIILEPILLFIVWIAVLGVAVAVILPIYSLVGNFNNSL